MHEVASPPGGEYNQSAWEENQVGKTERGREEGKREEEGNREEGKENGRGNKGREEGKGNERGKKGREEERKGTVIEGEVKIIGREGEGKRDKELGRWGGKIGVNKKRDLGKEIS